MKTLVLLFLMLSSVHTSPVTAQLSNDPLTVFARYVKNGHQAEAQKMLDAAYAGRLEINLEAAAGWVAWQGNIDLLRQLLDHGIDPNAPGWDSRAYYKDSIVFDAVDGDQMESLQLLLERGGNPTPALFMAAEEKKLEAVEMLLDWGADVNATLDGRTPLHYAAKKWGGYRPEVTFAIGHLLINRGAEVDPRSPSSVTPLYYAAESSPALVQLLLEHGADPNITYTSPMKKTTLTNAIGTYIDVEEKVWVIRMLLEAGADPNIKISYTGGMISPLERAKHQDPKVKELLKEYGATIQGRSQNIQEAQEEGRIDEVRRFIDSGINANTRHEDGCPLLHHAVQYGQMEIVQLLLDHGASVQFRNNHGSTALLIAPQYQANPAYVELLLSNGSDISATCVDGDTPLHILAMFQDNVDIAKVLLAGGANIDSKNKKGQTAYDIAISKDHEKLAAMLLENGAKK